MKRHRSWHFRTTGRPEIERPIAPAIGTMIAARPLTEDEARHELRFLSGDLVELRPSAEIPAKALTRTIGRGW